MDADAEAIVRELFAAFARRDLAAAMPLVHPECRFWPQGTAEAVGRTTPYVGWEGAEAYFADASSAWETLELRADDVRSAAAGIVCFGVAIGRLRGEADEQRIPVIWVFRLRDGLIVFGRVVPTAAEAWGLVAPRASAG